MLLNSPLWFSSVAAVCAQFSTDSSLCCYYFRVHFFPNPRLAFSSEHYLCDLTATPLILHTPEAVTSLPPSQELNTQ